MVLGLGDGAGGEEGGGVGGDTAWMARKVMRRYHLSGSVHYSSRFDLRWSGGGGGVVCVCQGGGVSSVVYWSTAIIYECVALTSLFQVFFRNVSTSRFAKMSRFFCHDS